MRAQVFRQRYQQRLEFGRRMAHPEAVARAMAWNEVAAIWHRHHGQRICSAMCAGCGRPLSGAWASLLPHGERAHANPDSACVLAYGRRWKQAAAGALAEVGIPAPAEILEICVRHGEADE